MSPAELASFWALCLAQGTIVLLPGAVRSRRLEALRARWLLIAAPAAAVIGATFIPRIADLLAADLSLLALLSVPPLAVAGAVWAIRWRDVRLAPLVPLLLVAAWSAPRSRPGEAATLLLVVLSCVALAVLVVAVLPPAVAKLGILVWAAADLSFALAHDLVRASSAISHAAPALAPDLVRLQLQRVVIGQSSMEYADLFIAATLGAILAAESRGRGPAALLVAVLAMSLAPFFLVTDVVPGTVPVAAALLLGELRFRLRPLAEPDRPPDRPIGGFRPASPGSSVGGMASEFAVVVRDLHKSYGEIEAVAGVDLTIERGEVFALLGPNGAGKTTTVEILEGYRRRTAGEVSVLGVDPETGGRALRERIGIVPQESGTWLDLTVAETIELFSAAYPRRRPVAEVTELVGLEDSRDALVRTLSGGQRRRLDLALAVAGDPELLFLDEPTTGFDPSARRRSWSLIENLRSLGKTILLTTHYMDEAQNLADRVAVIARGRIVAEGAPALLAGRANGAARVSFRLPAGLSREALPLPTGIDLEGDDGHVSFRTDTPTRALTPLVDWADAHGQELEELTVTRPSLEDVYLELTEEGRS